MRTRTGLEILFARRKAGDGLDDVPDRDIAGELRERFWIRKVANADRGGRLWTIAISTPRWIERQEVGRDRNQPGDGFRYLYREGTDGTESRAEWFEVTEVFERVAPKAIETFMRAVNGCSVDPAFAPNRFLGELEMGIPCRAAQRRAADRVIAAIDKKLKKASYADMWRRHGYGTLIVGLPLWFAMVPANPTRARNVVDDFVTRVRVTLGSYKRQLKKQDCPFWKIVVVWLASRESVLELRDRVRYDIYDDPAYRKLSGWPGTPATQIRLWLKTMALVEENPAAVVQFGGFPMSLAVAVNRKKPRHDAALQLPPDVLALKRAMEDAPRNRAHARLFERVKWGVMRRVAEILGFIRSEGLHGFRRWAGARLSPRCHLTRLAAKLRARHLYRASQRRPAR